MLSELWSKYSTTHNVILLGDFNGSLFTKRHSRDQVFRDWANVRNLLPPANYPKDDTYLHPSGNSKSCIDYILSSEPSTVTDVQILTLLASNTSSHVPVSANLHTATCITSPEAEQTSPAVKVTPDWNKCDRPKYCQIVRDLISVVPIPVDIPSAEATCESIIDICKFAASKSIPPVKQKRSNTKSWDGNVSRAMAHNKQILQAWRLAGSPRSGHLWESKKLSKKALRKSQRCATARARNKIYEDVMTASYGNVKLFYRLIQRQRGQTSPKGLQLILNDALVSNPKEVLDLWTSHMSQLAMPTVLPEFDQKHFDLINEDLVVMESLVNDQLIHHKDINREEITKAVSVLNPGKAADISGLQAEHIKIAICHLADHLQAIANRTLKTGKTLANLQKAYVIPVYKKGKCQFNLDSYRGITITSTLSKMIEHLIGFRIRDLFQQNPLQFGFTKGQSPILAILAVTEAIAQSITTKISLYVITLDVKKAFDVVCHASLLRKLFPISDANSWKFIQNSLQTVSSVRLQDSYGDSFQVHQGVGQGKILSTHNYKVYVNNLLDLLQSSGCGAKIGPVYLGSPTCADDIVLLANTPSEMQAQLDIVSNYSKRERYVIHPDKSKYIAYASKFPPTFQLDNKEVHLSDSLTHLGVDRYHNNLTADSFIEDRISLGRRTAYSLMGAGFHGTNGISPEITIRMYRIYVLPRYLFGLEAIILSNKQLQQLSDFHKSCIRDLQSLPVRTALCAIYLLGGILPVEAYLDSRIATLLCMVGQDTQSPLLQIALHQYATGGVKSRSWFVYAGVRLSKYSIDPLDLLQQLVKKNQAKRVIREYWHNLLVTEATEKSTLVHMNFEAYPAETVHPIWSTVGAKSSETRKAIIKARLLTGTYILQSNKARFNQYILPATCHLCHGADEDLRHFLLECSCMSKLREEYLVQIDSLVSGFSELCVVDKIKLILDSKCGLAESCDRNQLELVTRDFVYRLHCKRVWFLNQEAPV
jgi:hypothetical protein